MNKLIAAIAILATCLSIQAQAPDSSQPAKSEPKVTPITQPKSSLGLSVETLGVAKQSGFMQGSPTYGAGVNVGIDFNKYVRFNVRALAYETDDWGGGVIDEGGLGVGAKLFSSANGKILLSAIGGVNRDFQNDNWGIGLGARTDFVVYKDLYIFGQLEYQLWDEARQNTLAGVGLGLKF